jgi:uncharacterized RDD family membrane protein YckC
VRRSDHGPIFYFILTTWEFGGTLGQFATGLRVVQTDYRRLTFGQAAGRLALAVFLNALYGLSFLASIRGMILVRADGSRRFSSISRLSR